MGSVRSGMHGMWGWKKAREGVERASGGGENEGRWSKSAYFVGMVAAVGGFLYGYDTGLVNGLLEMEYVKQHFPTNGRDFTVFERAIITAILSLGTFCGALCAPIISDRYGRKFSIIVSASVIFTVGNILQVVSNSVPLLCVGRYVSGSSVGILSAIVPLYQAEASPKRVRGSIVFTYQWAITWGLLIANAVSQGTKGMKSSGSYRIPIALQFLWTLVLCGGMLLLPESPRYFVQKNNIQKALDSLAKLRKLPHDDATLIEELVEIKANYDYEMSFGKTTFLDCFKNGGGRHKQVLRMLTGIGLHAFQQCSGINFIFYYGANFFSSAGLKNPYMMSFVTYAVNVLFTIPGILFIDVIGRRKILLIGGTGMACSNLIIAITGTTISNSSIASIVSISFSCVFIAFFAASWGGAPWAVASDIYGISIRQKAISVAASTNWLVNFTFAFVTPYLIDTGEHTAELGNKIFFIWGGLNTFAVLFVYLMVYETKDLKLEEIDFMYLNCSSARSSTRFKSQKINYKNMDGVKRTGSGHHQHTTSTDGTSDEKNNDPSNDVQRLNNNIGTENITIIPYTNNDSGSGSDSVSFLDTSLHEDYEAYLHSLRESSDVHGNNETSQTSASFRDLVQFKQSAENEKSDSVEDKTTTNIKSFIYTGAAGMPNSVHPKLVVPSSFYMHPPSDTDSEDDLNEADAESEAEARSS